MTDRRAGSVGVTVDLALNPDRRVGWVGLTVDYVPATYSTTVSATQATAVARSFTVIPGGPIQITRSTTQAQSLALAMLRSRVVTATVGQSVSLQRAVSLARRVQQAQTALIAGTLARAVTITQATSARLLKQVRVTRVAASVAQVASSAIGRGFQRTVSAVQATAVSLRKTLVIVVRLTGNRRVSMTVTIAPALARSLRITSPTSVRLVKQIRLTRSVTQAQSVSRQGIPVKLVAITAVQTRSLALGRALSLIRTIGQPTLAVLPRALDVLRTLQVAPALARVQEVSLSRSVAQGAVVSLSAHNVTPFIDLVVTTHVSQSLSISSVGAGKSAADFSMLVRGGDFVVSGRELDAFSVPSRGTAFRVEQP